VAIGLLAIGSLAAGLSGAQTGPAVDRVTWITGVAPAGTGEKLRPGPFSFRLEAFIESRWPEVKHVMITANPLRAVKMLADGEPACVLTFAHTPERERMVYFSDVLLEPPPEVIVRKDRQHLLPRNASGEVVLSQLLVDKRLRGAVVRGRSYGKFVDEALEKAPSTGELTRYAAADFGSNIIVMVGMGRLDYTIVRDMGTELEISPKDSLADTLVAEPIEGANTPERAGVACPRTPWGRAVIERVDAIMSTPEGVALLRAETERGMSAAERHRFANQINALFHERARANER
jgi:uncharacterized protein (TIGR02285 family)